MTKAQFNEKLHVMKKEMNQEIEKECLRLLNSGAVDIGSYDDDYLLPKLILCAALQNSSKQYLPFAKEHIKKVKNLLNF